MCIIGIDASLRSTGLCFIDCEKNLISYKLIKSKPNSLKANKNKPYPELNDEDLIIYNTEEVVKFVEECLDESILDGMAIEGLSFAGVSGSKDLIHGSFWGILTGLRINYPEIPCGKIPVASWRSPLTTKEERKEYKELYKKKGIKKLIVDKLPENVRLDFERYIKENKYGKDDIFDLSDSYFLACHRLGLE